jgi:ATP-dependent DNA helicase RecG
LYIELAVGFALTPHHPRRGRVGRAAAASTCILIAPGSPEAVERLRAVQGTNDGFAIARADLRIRGMGDFFGARQHGLPELRFFDPETDEELLLHAREHAFDLVLRDPDLDMPAHHRIRDILHRRYGDRERLYQVG